MRTIETDVAIIGAGTAGLNARREVEHAGKRWLLIDSGPYGSTCARVGCMPSKLLIAAAESAREARRAREFGIRLEPESVHVDGAAVMARVRRERDRFVRSIVEEIEALPSELRLRGAARFLGPNELQVGANTRVHANAIVIATGSAPRMPEQLRVLSDGLHTNQTIFELDDLPESLAVFGTGPVGLELGQAFAELGVRVRFFDPGDELGPFTDPEVERRFRVAIRAQDSFAMGVERLELQPLDSGFRVRYRGSEGRGHHEDFERVLVAAGRVPRLEQLDLARAGLELDEEGLPPIDPETMQCAESPIFIAGDATGARQVLHEAIREGCVAGANAALYPEVRRRSPGKPMTIGFTSPQLAMVGARYDDLRGTEIVIGDASYGEQGRARVMAESEGFMRLYFARKTTQFLGAEMFAPRAEHLGHLLAWGAECGVDLRRMLEMPFYHPTLEEGVRTAIRHAASQLGLRPDCASSMRGHAMWG